jgi:Mg-chelatase subunit ChlD
LNRIARHFGLAGFALLLGAGNFNAQDNPCLNRTVAVNVMTEDGRLVKGLTASNFRAKLNGKPIDITSVDYDDGPHRVVILLDVSGSMTGSYDRGPWPAAMAVLKSLLSSASSQTSFAFCTFARDMEVTVQFGKGSKAVIEALQKLETTDWSPPKGPGRYTALWDAISRAVDLLRPSQPGDAIFLVTDGGENVSKERDREVKDALVRSQARLFTFLTLELLPVGRPLESVNGPEVLQDWARSTGGDLFYYPPRQRLSPNLVPDAELEMRAENPKLIPEAARLLAEEMSEVFAVHIKLPEPIEKPRDLKLEIVNALGKKHPPVRIVYPHKLAPCEGT